VSDSNGGANHDSPHPAHESSNEKQSRPHASDERKPELLIYPSHVVDDEQGTRIGNQDTRGPTFAELLRFFQSSTSLWKQDSRTILITGATRYVVNASEFSKWGVSTILIRLISIRAFKTSLVASDCMRLSSWLH
jgi:hypothetical protein